MLKPNFRTERQIFLNQYPQYQVSVQGLNIVYIHVKPKLPENSNIKVLPLLLLHGWPGSVREFYEIIPLLTELQDGIVLRRENETVAFIFCFFLKEEEWFLKL